MANSEEDNMRIWNAIGITNPAHTKKFQRAGGFKGTAIKPIYTEQKMTEVFGPAGKGWGMGEPVFQVVPGVNQEVMVYCTVPVWWADDTNPDEFGEERYMVYGVGGDKVVSYVKANDQYNRPERWENDDEAFKKAFTDAVGNAMKHLGMSADVHMGLFDDSKYVREREDEERGASSKPAPPHDPETGEITEPPVAMSKETARPHYEAVAKALSGATTLKQLQGVWERSAPVVKSLPTEWIDNITDHKNSLKDSFMEKEAALKIAQTP